MPSIFITHASTDDLAAEALRLYLVRRGFAPDDIFVDHALDGLTAGERWKAGLGAAATSADALICLITPKWLDSHWSQVEHRVVQLLKEGDRHRTRAIIGAVWTGITRAELRANYSGFADDHSVELHAGGKTIDLNVELPGKGGQPARKGTITFNADALAAIEKALVDLGIRRDHFAWTPEMSQDGSPYPGLEAFQESEAGIFFGRDGKLAEVVADIEALANNPHGKRVITIAAASGAGKSSFLRAGLWPRLGRRPSLSPLVILRPGVGLLTAERGGFVHEMARWFQAHGQSVDAGKIWSWLGRPPTLTGAATVLQEAAKIGGDGKPLLIGIDQAEEAFDVSDPERSQEAHNLLDHLLDLIASPPHGVDAMLVFAIRDDSNSKLASFRVAAYDRIIANQAPRAGALDNHLVGLDPLDRTAYRDVITRPAKVARKTTLDAFSPQLVDRLIDNHTGADALPLLAMTLRQLHATFADGREITVADYETLYGSGDGAAGPVAQALKTAYRQANAHDGDAGRDEILKPLLIPELVTWDPKAGTNGAPKRRIALREAAIGGDPRLARLADEMISPTVRLLVQADTPAGPTLEVAHEALLRVEPIKSWAEALKHQFALRDELEGEAATWQAAVAHEQACKSDETPGNEERRAEAARKVADATLVRRGSRLEAAQSLVADEAFTTQVGPKSLIGQFVAACAAHEKADSDRRRRLAGLAFVKPAEEANKRGEHEHALRLAAAGALLAEDLGFELVPELWSPMALSLFRERSSGVTMAPARVVLKARSCGLIREPEGSSIAASFSPDGARVLTVLGSWMPRIWDAATGIEIATLYAHRGWIEAASFSPDGERVVTASEDQTARIFDDESGAEFAVLKAHTDCVRAAEFSPNGKFVVTASHDHTARLWSAETGGEVAILKGHTSEVNAASFSPDSRHVVTASDDHTACLWDAATGTKVANLKGHNGSVKCASFGPDGTKIVTGSSDNTGRIWDAATGNEFAVLNAHTSFVNVVSFSSDGQRVVTASDDHTACLWDAATGTRVAHLKGHTGSVKCASFGADGTCVVTASEDGSARIWDSATTSEIAVLKAHTSSVTAASFGPDGTRVVTASDDQTARIWNTATGAEIAVLKAHISRVLAVSFSGDGKRVLTGSDDQTARIWDAATGTERAVLNAHYGRINAVSFSPDGTRVATASDDQTARVWDAATGRSITILRAHTSRIIAALFSSDGKQVVTTAADQTVRFWDVASGAEINFFKVNGARIASASFSSDWTRMVTISADNTARVWDVLTGTEITCLQDATSFLKVASFGPDGTRVVTVSVDNTVRIWDVGMGTVIAIWKAHSSDILSASFSPDGTRLVTTSFDETARIFDVSGSKTLTRGRDIVLTASLACGIGWRTDTEAQDFLMQDVQEDMFAEALRQTGRSANDPELQEVIKALNAPLHPNCYLSPTQFAEKFGLDRPEAAAVNDAGDDDEATADGSNEDRGKELKAPIAPSDAKSIPDTAWHAPAAPPPLRRWWQLPPKPAKHSQRAAITAALADLPADAPIRILSDSQAFEDRLAVYEVTNAKAVKAQTAYKRWGGVALGLATVATLIAAATLLPVSALVPVEADRYVSGLQALANILALLIVWWLGRAGAIDRWLTTRAEAERLRGQLFADLLAAPALPGSDVKALWSQKLALFNSAHVDYQRGYLAGARKRHTKAAAGLSWPRTLAFGATALSIIVGVCAFFGFWPDDFLTIAPWLKLAEEPVRWQLGLGTFASGLLAYASARTLIHQDERNAALYRHTGARLDELVAAQGKAAEEATARGDGAAVIDYAQEVQAVLNADHTAWQFHRPPRDPVGSAPGVDV